MHLNKMRAKTGQENPARFFLLKNRSYPSKGSSSSGIKLLVHFLPALSHIAVGVSMSQISKLPEMSETKAK